MAFGWTKLTASIRRTPVVDSASISSTFASVGTGASFCRPSRGPTSRRLIDWGRSLMRSRLVGVPVGVGTSFTRVLRTPFTGVLRTSITGVLRTSITGVLRTTQSAGVEQCVAADRPRRHSTDPVALVAVERGGELAVDQDAARPG